MVAELTKAVDHCPGKFPSTTAANQIRDMVNVLNFELFYFSGRSRGCFFFFGGGGGGR